jgi:hypothetical protein
MHPAAHPLNFLLIQGLIRLPLFYVLGLSPQALCTEKARRGARADPKEPCTVATAGRHTREKKPALRLSHHAPQPLTAGLRRMDWKEKDLDHAS